MARPGRVWPSSVLSPLCRAASETPASARGAEATRGLGLPGAAARPARASGAAGAARPPRVCVRAPAIKRGRPRPGLRAHGPARGPGTRALGTRAPRDRPLALRGQRQSDPAVRAPPSGRQTSARPGALGGGAPTDPAPGLPGSVLRLDVVCVPPLAPSRSFTDKNTQFFLSHTT